MLYSPFYTSLKGFSTLILIQKRRYFGYGFWYPYTIEAIISYFLFVWQMFLQINYPRHM